MAFCPYCGYNLKFIYLQTGFFNPQSLIIMKLKNLLAFLILGPAMGVSMMSCVSTDVLDSEPQPVPQKDEIIVKVSSPEISATRATDGYKLRYVAKIFQGSANWGAPYDRKEIIEGENENQVIFKVEPNQNYAIMVFADYIPDSYEPDDKGLYKDYFYNTGVNNSNSKKVSLRATPGKDGTTMSQEFFNNPYYDAFFGFEKVTKKPEELEVNMTLKRTTAMVVMRENSENTGDLKIKINSLGVLSEFTMDNQTVFSGITSYSNGFSLEESVTIDAVNKDLLYFYTLADPTTSNLKVKVSFDVISNDGKTQNFSVTDIPVQANHRTIVKGAFLPAPESDPLPGEDNEPKEGDIILNLSSNYTWESEDLSKDFSL